MTKDIVARLRSAAFVCDACVPAAELIEQQDAMIKALLRALHNARNHIRILENATVQS